MDWKPIITEMCVQLESDARDLHSETVRVEFYQNWLSGSLSNKKRRDLYVVEIRVNGRVIVAEKRLKSPSEAIHVVEEFVLKKLVQTIFNMGIMLNRKLILEQQKQRPHS